MSFKRKAPGNHRIAKRPKRAKVAVNALKWTEAALPDRLDDAEGFYALEEIDDVEVVRDEAGQVSFHARKELVDEPQEEWSGFEDDSPHISTSAVPEANETHQSQSAAISAKERTDKTDKTSRKPVVPTVSEEPELEDEIDFTTLSSVDVGESADVTAWKELGLSQAILSAISTLGFSDPTPIQRFAIPPIVEGRDVIGKAVTGSGKTLAFGIPIIEKWLAGHQNPSAKVVEPRNLLAFILAPTRELAHQLTKHLMALCKGLGHDQSPRIATVTGGLSVIKQQRQLKTADIVIGTPGRIWDVINSSQGLIDRLKKVNFLVIDEADRLLSGGHYQEIEEILDVLDRKIINEGGEDAGEGSTPESTDTRQTLVFSATFQKDLQQRLAGKQKWKQQQQPQGSNLLSNTQSLDHLLQKLKFQAQDIPAFVDANPVSQMAENLNESVLQCGAMQRDLYLYSLLLLHHHEHAKSLRGKKALSQQEKVTRTLVFTNSIATVKRLVPLLNTLLIPQAAILPLHSSMPQKSRLRSLERFQTPPDQNTTTVILIATDVAARGLDIKGIDTIIHYHVPRTADTYVHRSGRTARSHASGRSILLCSPEEFVGVTRLILKVHSDKETTDQKPPQTSNPITPFYLPGALPTQLSHRVQLAQKITDAHLDVSKTNSESNFLRTAAEELGVEYDSSEFEATDSRHRRGRGGGRDRKRKENVQSVKEGKVESWKAGLRADLKDTRRKIDFGDGEGRM